MFNNSKYPDNKSAFWFLLPCLLGCSVFIIIPVFFSFGLSFYDWNLLTTPHFVKFDNYIELFKEPEFYQVFKNTVVYAIFTTLFGVLIPLFLADILNRKFMFSDFFKTAYFIPFITPMLVIALIWAWIFDPNIGFMNYILRTNIQWLYNPDTAMIAVIAVSVWKLIGYNTVILIGGYACINSSLPEAAEIDGANKLQIFFRIILPLLSPVIFFLLIVTTISSFQIFDLIYLMTQGGPNGATDVLVYWLYKNSFEYFNIGRASAAAYILFIIIAVLSLCQWAVRKLWVYGEE
ncbi:MAG: sugar ABC transporter permease [Candidatus Gastranaerophilales bacterium]|nr:sugar ABC transporter permease [Candidatus Gastranaerophilales bacterium]